MVEMPNPAITMSDMANETRRRPATKETSPGIVIFLFIPRLRRFPAGTRKRGECLVAYDRDKDRLLFRQGTNKELVTGGELRSRAGLPGPARSRSP